MEHSQQRWESFTILALENAQLQVREHLYGQIDFTYRKFEALKLKSLILSRDAQLHINASSLPSLTVKRKNVIFPISHPALNQNPQQSTPQFVWTESLLWNLVNTMELDAPCRGLKTKRFKYLIITVAEFFSQQALTQFQTHNDRSLYNLLSHKCSQLVKATKGFRNTDEKKIEVILHCSQLLVLSHLLNFEQLQSSSSRQSGQYRCLQKKEPKTFECEPKTPKIMSSASLSTQSTRKTSQQMPEDEEFISLMTDQKEVEEKKETTVGDDTEMSFEAVDLPDESDVKITRELALRLQEEIRKMNCDSKKFNPVFFRTFIKVDDYIPWDKRKAMMEGFDFLVPFFDKLRYAPLREIPHYGASNTSRGICQLWLTIRALDDKEDNYIGPISEILSSLEVADDRSGHLRKRFNKLLHEVRRQLDLEERKEQS